MSKLETNVNSIKPALLLQQYVQSHENLRESNRKRDITLGVYITLNSALFGFYCTTSGDKPFNALIAATVFLICLGLILSAIFTMYRGWHGLYIITIITLQKMFHSQSFRLNGEFIKEINFKFNNIFSVELLLFAILHLILVSDVVAIMLVPVYSWWKIYLIVFLFFLIVVSISVHFVVMKKLDNAKNNGKLGTDYLWILQGTINCLPTKQSSEIQMNSKDLLPPSLLSYRAAVNDENFPVHKAVAVADDKSSDFG